MHHMRTYVLKVQVPYLVTRLVDYKKGYKGAQS